MTTHAARLSVALLQWIKGHPYTLLATILFVALALPFLRKVDSQFDNVYLRAANHLQAGDDLYRLEDGYLYPPFMAWLAVPFTWLPRLGARVAWYLTNVLCMTLLWRWAWKLSSGPRLEGVNAPWKEHFICVLGLACALRFGIDCLQNQQTDLVVAVLVLGGCLLLTSGSGLCRAALTQPLAQLLAATCFGLAAGMKCTALLFAPYLLWRGRWLAALWLGVVALGVNLVPNLVSSPPMGGLWLGQWAERYLAHLGRSDVHAGVWGSAVLMNQSISGAAYRWFVTEWTWTPTGFEITTRADALSPIALKLFVYGFQMLLLSAAALVLGRPGRQRGEADPAERAPFEFSLVLLLMLLLSPMSSKPHYCTLLLPAFLLARRMVLQSDRVAGACLVAAILAGALSTKDLAGANLASLVMWLGGVSASAFLLLVGCGWVLVQARRSPACLLQRTLPSGPRYQQAA